MKVPYLFLTLAEAEGMVSPTLPLFSDTETNGFYGRVEVLQLMQLGWDAVIMVQKPDPFELAIFLGKFDTKWYNAHYDITTVQQVTETRWIPKEFDCTFLLARLHYAKKEKFALDDVLVYLLGYCPYERQGLDKKKLQKSKWSVPVLSESQKLYAATDVYFLPQLWEVLEYKRDTQSYKLDKSTLRTCLGFQWNGMPANRNLIMHKARETQAELDKMAMPININSWQQVRPYIGESESDDLALARFHLAEGNERAGQVRKARKLTKLLSFLAKYDTLDGRVYGKFKPSARSGRLTSNDQNQQQHPRKLKGMFGYQPSAGRVLIYADYAQIQLRIVCAIVNCTSMAKLFREGADLHRYTADMVFGTYESLYASAVAVAQQRVGDTVGLDRERLDRIGTGVKIVWKKHRQVSKTYNFNFLFGGGIKMILSILLKEADIIQTEVEANKNRRKWRSLWKEIYAWQEKGIAAWKKGKSGFTPLGREYTAKMMTDQLCIEIQGAESEVAKLALHYLAPDLATYEDTKLINFIHDSFIIDAPDDPAIYEPVAKIVAERMQEAWFEMSKLFNIKDLPMPVDVKVGYNWGGIENDDIPNLYEFNLAPYEMLEKVNG